MNQREKCAEMPSLLHQVERADNYNDAYGICDRMERCTDELILISPPALADTILTALVAAREFRDGLGDVQPPEMVDIEPFRQTIGSYVLNVNEYFTVD